MKTFVISLMDSVARREYMATQLQSLKLDFVFSPAIDGRKLSETEKKECCDFKWMKRYMGRILTPTEIGCALSHIAIYKKIVAENIPYALVLEDDAWITPSLIPLLGVMEERKIFDDGGVFLVQDNACGYWNKKHGKQIVLSDMYRFNEINCACWAHAYIVTRQAAENMLRYLYPVTHVADCWGWLIHHHVTTIYGLNFTLTTQNNYSFASTIGMERFILRRSLVEKIFRPFWRLFWMEFDKYIPLRWYR